MTGDADHLAEIGRALYGEHWQAPLARDLGVNRESIRRWLNGSSPFGPAHGAWRDLRTVLEGIRNRAATLLADLPPTP